VAPAKGPKVVDSDDGAMGPPRIPSNNRLLKKPLNMGGPHATKVKTLLFHFQHISRKVSFADQIGRKEAER
jgi:hypothetical protein